MLAKWWAQPGFGEMNQEQIKEDISSFLAPVFEDESNWQNLTPEQREKNS